MKKYQQFYALLLTMVMAISLSTSCCAVKTISNELPTSDMLIVSDSATLINLLQEPSLAQQSMDTIASAKTLVADMPDDECSEFIAELVNQTESSDYEQLQNNLALIGIELSDKSEAVSPLYIRPSQFTIDVYSAKRTGVNKYYLYATVYASAAEPGPGTIDVLAFYFDSDKCEYDDYNYSGETVTLSDYHQRNSGCVLFNYEDCNMTENSFGEFGKGTAILHVIPTVSDGEVDFSAQIHHTYRTTELDTVGGTADLDFTSEKIGGHVSVSVTGANGEFVYRRENADSFTV